LKAGEDLEPGDACYIGEDGKLYKNTSPSPPTDREAFEEVYGSIHGREWLARPDEDYESTRTNEAWYAFQLHLAAIRQAARTGGGV